MLLLVLALWKRGGVTAWMSVRSIEGIYDEGYTTTRENVATRVFFRSFLEDVSTGRGAGGRARRARVLGRRTPVNPPSLTGRRPDASATSLCAVEWSAGSGRQRRFGVGTRPTRANAGRVLFAGGGHRATRSRDDAAPPEGRATGYRVGTDAACVPEPSQRLLGVREFHLRVRGVLRVRLRARGRRPRRCRNTLGRAHRARVEAARRERERRTRARTRPRGFSKARERRVPIGLEMDARASVPRAELKCGVQEIFLRAFKARGGAEELKPKETHVSECLPIQVGEAGPTAGARSESTIRVASCGFRDVACRLSPPRALLRARVTQPLATQET